MDFEEYKNGRFRHIHVNTIILLWLGTIITLCAELSLFFVTLKANRFPQTAEIYFVKRIVIPSGINILTTIVTTIIVYSKEIEVSVKNYFCSFAVLICVTGIAAFHTYYNLMILSISFGFFYCVLYADKKLYLSILLCEIVSFIMVSIFFFNEVPYLEKIDKILMLVLFFLSLVISSFFSRVLLTEQVRQLDYIYTNYLRQTSLIEELKIEPMTHLYNKTCMEKCLDSIITNYETRSPSAIALIDLDNFKRINDRFGHESGDIVLLKLAEIMKKHMGGVTHCFRFGGEEFIITFENMTNDEIKKILTNMNKDLSDNVFAFAPKERITFTCGVAFLTKDMDRSKWFNCADEAMYRGKQSGRNRVMFYEDLIQK